VSITAWRITKRQHEKSAFNGAGAKKFGGRWNSPGTAVVYTSQTQSLAVLEVLVHLETPDLLQNYALIGVDIEEEFIELLDQSRLPQGWRSEPAPIALRDIGDEWVQAGNSAVLQVPSALVPDESNFLLNPGHKDFEKLRIRPPSPFLFDARLAR
jgi:RES domain-containing protein